MCNVIYNFTVKYLVSVSVDSDQALDLQRKFSTTILILFLARCVFYVFMLFYTFIGLRRCSFVHNCICVLLYAQ